MYRNHDTVTRSHNVSNAPQHKSRKGFLAIVGGTLVAALAIAANTTGIASFALSFRDSESSEGVPTFRGKIGQLEEGDEFVEFISNHDAKVVYLDIWAEAFGENQRFFNVSEGDTRGFTLSRPCQEGTVNPDPPNPLFLGCYGIWYRVVETGPPVESAIFYNQGLYHVKGYFAVNAVPGAHQGLLTVVLTGVAAKDALATVGPGRHRG
jgi:hypothetical protein